MQAIAQQEKSLIYLYDLPKNNVTSVKIAEIIKRLSGYEIQEPVQFRECKPHPTTGLASPFTLGIIKVEPSEWKRISEAIKYFTFDEGTEINGVKRQWECRALPFDRDLLGANKNATNNQMNVFVKNIPEGLSTKELDEKFSEIGSVKSAKISRSVKTELGVAESNGYGFVCYHSEQDRKKAEELGVIDQTIEIHRYQPKDPREIRKVYNNIYVKNFDPSWDKPELEEVFKSFGPIKSCVVMRKKDKAGIEKPFAFICFDQADDKSVGPASAQKAIDNLHDHTHHEHKLYVQPAIPKNQREAQVQREQQRFKNSKKKCNLFVKGFPNNFT